MSLEVASDMSIEDFKALIEADTGMPASSQFLTWNSKPLTDLTVQKLDSTFRNSSEKIQEDDMIIVSTSPPAGRRPMQSQTRPNDAELLRQEALVRPEVMDNLRSRMPALANAVHDQQEFGNIWRGLLKRQEDAEQEKAEQFRKLNDNHLDPENQQKIEEIIRMENVRNNEALALENIPESFAPTTMLYIPVIVNGVHIKAFVDSGAQATIMSGSCAERTGLMRLIDKRFAGVARGVGTAPILGRVHVAILSVANIALHCSFTVMEGKDVDLLLGLDMLKRHRACINLKKNVLEISDTEVPFLPESELPSSTGVLGKEPVIDGPGGTKIGGRSGAIVPPDEERSASASAAAGQSSAAGPSAGRAAGQAAAARAGSSAPPSRGPAKREFPRSSIEAVMSISGVSEEEAKQALSAANGNVEGAVGMFFGD